MDKGEKRLGRLLFDAITFKKILRMIIFPLKTSAGNRPLLAQEQRHEQGHLDMNPVFK